MNQSDRQSTMNHFANVVRKMGMDMTLGAVMAKAADEPHDHEVFLLAATTMTSLAYAATDEDKTRAEHFHKYIATYAVEHFGLDKEILEMFDENQAAARADEFPEII